MLLRIERDYAQTGAVLFRQFQPTAHPGDRFIGNGLRFDAVGPAFAAIIDAAGHLAQLYSLIVDFGRGEGDEPVAVIVVVRKGDQRFAAAAIVPTQISHRHARGLGFIENALQVFLVVRHIVVFFVAPEEIGRRQLFGVAHDDRLAAACNRADRIPGGNLRCFIENHYVE